MFESIDLCPRPTQGAEVYIETSAPVEHDFRHANVTQITENPLKLEIAMKRTWPSRSWWALALLFSACTRPTNAPEPERAAVVVKISYGSEKKTFLVDSIEAFHKSRPKTEAGRPIQIEAVAEGSAESMEAILAGRSNVAVWSPASSLLVDVLNDRWAEAHGGLGSGRKLVADAPPLMLSPVVIGLWEPMARALGWPSKPIGWSEVAQFAASREGWARYGHPEWGEFKFGHTHPRYSNSGAIALVAATYAGAGKTRDLQDDDVLRAQPFVRRVQASVVHYGRSTGFFAEKMLLRGPSYLSAAVLYENLVVESYQDSRYQNKPFPVVAVYPKEGTYWSDHPYAILDLPQVTPEIRAAAERFRAFLLSPERQRAALGFGFRPADPQVALGAPLDAAHGVDPAQPKNVLPNPPVAVTRKILDAFEDVKRPVSVTFVIDTSGSMAGEPLQQAKAGARVFLEGLPGGDTARVLFFSSRPRWHSEQAQRLDTARPALVQAVDSVFADGGTALYDTLLEALRPAPGEASGGVRVVVLLTDGQDTDSVTKLDALLDKLRGRGSEGGGGVARIFTIGYGPAADASVLQKIAEAGGGAFFAGTPKDIKSVYADLATFF
jgi:Ca-activated chloride channel family protein